MACTPWRDDARAGLPHPGGVRPEYVTHPVRPDLRPFVAGATGYRFDGTPSGLHRGLPSPWLTLVVTLDDPLEVVAHPDPRQSPAGTTRWWAGCTPARR